MDMPCEELFLLERCAFYGHSNIEKNIPLGNGMGKNE